MEKLSASLEDYLETIFILWSSHESVRAKDITEHMQVRKASVTGALRALAERNLINYSPYSPVTLTATGVDLGSKIVYRHKVLFEFLHKFLHLSPQISEINACRIEHSIDDITLERLVDFIKFLQSNQNFKNLLETFAKQV